MTAVQKKTTDQAQVPVTRESVLARYKDMVLMIPEAPESDGSEIIADILMATDIEQSQTKGKLPAGKELVGRTLKVDGLTRYESDQEGGVGWYLVADAWDTQTGEQVRFQTSAGSLMAWLVKLYISSALPAVIEITAEQTKGGRTAVGCIVRGASAKLALPPA